MYLTFYYASVRIVSCTELKDNCVSSTECLKRNKHYLKYRRIESMAHSQYGHQCQSLYLLWQLKWKSPLNGQYVLGCHNLLVRPCKQHRRFSNMSTSTLQKECFYQKEWHDVTLAFCPASTAEKSVYKGRKLQ